MPENEFVADSSSHYRLLTTHFDDSIFNVVLTVGAGEDNAGIGFEEIVREPVENVEDLTVYGDVVED